MNLLMTLLLGHLIADFSLQSNWIHRLKSRSWIGIALHVGIHIIVTAILLRRPVDAWPLLSILGLSHFALDWLKVRDTSDNRILTFLFDQAGHIMILVGLAWWMPSVESILPISFLQPLLLVALVPPFIFFIELIFDEHIVEKNIQVNQSDKISTEITGWSQYELFTYSRYTTVLLIICISAALTLAYLLPMPLTMKATAQVLTGKATVTAQVSDGSTETHALTREIGEGEVVLLVPGDRLETHDQTTALITYFDGQTTKVLSQSLITIEPGVRHETENRFEFGFWMGQTMTQLRHLLEPNSELSTNVSFARAIAPIE